MAIHIWQVFFDLPTYPHSIMSDNWDPTQNVTSDFRRPSPPSPSQGKLVACTIFQPPRSSFLYYIDNTFRNLEIRKFKIRKENMFLTSEIVFVDMSIIVFFLNLIDYAVFRMQNWTKMSDVQFRQTYHPTLVPLCPILTNLSIYPKIGHHMWTTP